MIIIEIKDTKKLLKMALLLLIFSIILDNITTYIALSQKSDLIRETNCVVLDYIKKYGLVNGLIYSEANMFIGYFIAVICAAIIFSLMHKQVLNTTFKEMIPIYLFYGIVLFSFLKIGASIVNIINTVIVWWL